MSMSLDGFISGPDDDNHNPLGVNRRRLHDWLPESGSPGGFRPSDASGEVFDELLATGAVVVGHRRGQLPDPSRGD